ncbi:hypothetical protein ACLB1E_31415 [Escherichia coli]
MNYPGTRYTKQMMETVCYPAMEEVAQELRLRGAYVELKSLPPEEGQRLGHLDLLVHMGEEQNFVYQIRPRAILGAGLYLPRTSAGNRPTTAGNLPC